MRIAVIAVFLCYFAYVSAVTPVQKCPESKSLEDLKQSISVGNCKKTPCRFKKRRSVKAEFRFTPDRDVENVKNTVNAIIAGLPLPFIGIDGTSACNQLYQPDGTTKASCPLKGGQEYVYKNQFDILEIYPVLKMTVHWGLTANDGKDVMCFRVPARITN